MDFSASPSESPLFLRQLLTTNAVGNHRTQPVFLQQVTMNLYFLQLPDRVLQAASILQAASVLHPRRSLPGAASCAKVLMLPKPAAPTKNPSL